MRKRKKNFFEKRNSESGVITVEACTSLMIFVFAFYMVLELMKVFAVEACMQDVLTSVAMDVSMGNYYGVTQYYDSTEKEKMSAEYKSMTGLVADDYSDARLSTIDATFSGAESSYIGGHYYGYGDTDANALAAYHMKEQSNIKRLVADEKVKWFNIDVRAYSGGKVVVNGEYDYELFNIPFLEDGGFSVFFEQDAVTYTWE